MEPPTRRSGRVIPPTTGQAVPKSPCDQSGPSSSSSSSSKEETSQPGLPRPSYASRHNGRLIDRRSPPSPSLSSCGGVLVLRCLLPSDCIVTFSGNSWSPLKPTGRRTQVGPRLSAALLKTQSESHRRVTLTNEPNEPNDRVHLLRRCDQRPVFARSPPSRSPDQSTENAS